MAMAVSMRHMVKISGEILQIMLMETHQISNLRSQDISKEILSGVVRKDVAEFSDKFSHFQYATGNV